MLSLPVDRRSFCQSHSRSIWVASADHQRYTPMTMARRQMAPARRPLGRNGPHAIGKPELVHEMPERTAAATRQLARQYARRLLEGRFKSVAILDEESLPATCAGRLRRIDRPCRTPAHSGAHPRHAIAAWLERRPSPGYSATMPSQPQQPDDFDSPWKEAVYRRPVVSLAVLCDEQPGWRPDHFVYNNWRYEVGIRFPVLKLIDYRLDEAALEQSANPFASRRTD
jgi:hypothetical protein